MLNNQLIIDALLKISEEVSNLALSYFKNLKLNSISYKGEKKDIVSEIDILIEDKIESFLKNCFPYASFIGEETNNIDVFDDKSELLFITDPIDGTSNYIYGIDFFSISIGVVSYGQLIGGVVSIPQLGEMYCALKNCEPIFLEIKNNNRCNIEINTLFHENKYLIGTTYPCINLIYEKLSKRISVRIFGSLAIAICYAIIGKLDGFVSNSAQIWDIAGGVGIARALGVELFFQQNNDQKTYTIIMHREASEVEIIKKALGF